MCRVSARVTVWDKLADKLLSEWSEGYGDNPIIILTSCKITIYCGKSYLLIR